MKRSSAAQAANDAHHSQQQPSRGRYRDPPQISDSDEDPDDPPVIGHPHIGSAVVSKFQPDTVYLAEFTLEKYIPIFEIDMAHSLHGAIETSALAREWLVQDVDSRTGPQWHDAYVTLRDSRDRLKADIQAGTLHTCVPMILHTRYLQFLCDAAMTIAGRALDRNQQGAEHMNSRRRTNTVDDMTKLMAKLMSKDSDDWVAARASDALFLYNKQADDAETAYMDDVKGSVDASVDCSPIHRPNTPMPSMVSLASATAHHAMVDPCDSMVAVAPVTQPTCGDDDDDMCIT